MNIRRKRLAPIEPDEPFTHCAGCGKALPVEAHPTDPAFCSIDCGYAYNGLKRNR